MANTSDILQMVDIVVVMTPSGRCFDLGFRGGDEVAFLVPL